MTIGMKRTTLQYWPDLLPSSSSGVPNPRENTNRIPTKIITWVNPPIGPLILGGEVS